MKKTAALLMALIMMCVCVSCASSSDAEYIEKKGTLIIGITYFEPMNYLDGDELTGFETEFAKKVCEKLNLTPVFQEINWDTKEIELAGKTIDCIWNGMTITPERLETLSISTAYMSNKQVLVVKSENLDKYTDAASFSGAKLVAEVESAGETVVKENELFAGAEYTAVDSMKTAVMEVAAGTADACVVDYVTSIGMIGEGTSYSGLAVDGDFAFDEETYGIALRKGSDMTEKINAVIAGLLSDGFLETLAAKYKLEDQLITK